MAPVVHSLSSVHHHRGGCARQHKFQMLRRRGGANVRGRGALEERTAERPVMLSNIRSRSNINEWCFKELGVDVDVVYIDMAAGEHKGPRVEAANPFGKLPALEHGEDMRLFESGAILLYADELYGKPKNAAQRAVSAQWVLFANSTMGNALFLKQNWDKQLPDIMGRLDKILAERQYLVEDEFSVSDIAVGSYLLYLPLFFPELDLSPWQNVLDYMQRLSERKAYKETLGARIASGPPIPTRVENE